MVGKNNQLLNVNKTICCFDYALKNKVEDNKEVIRSRNSYKNRKYNGQKNKENKTNIGGQTLHRNMLTTRSFRG